MIKQRLFYNLLFLESSFFCINKRPFTLPWPDFDRKPLVHAIFKVYIDGIDIKGCRENTCNAKVIFI